MRSSQPFTIAVEAPTAPLSIDAGNPYLFRYDGRPLVLAGSQNLRLHADFAFARDIPAIMSEPGGLADFFDAYRERGWNFYRLWCYHSTGLGAVGSPNGEFTSPLPWLRTGPGNANDGLPKFDLSRYEQAFYDRLEQVVAVGKEHGIIFAIMLWDAYAFGGTSFIEGSPWHEPNNINGVAIQTAGADDNGWSGMFGSPEPDVVDFQNDYVKKTIDVLNGYPNLMWELSNELYGSPWHEDLRDLIRSYEAGLPYQHLILCSHGGRAQDDIWTSRAPQATMDLGDCLAPGHNWRDDASIGGNFRSDPPLISAYADKPGIADMDHIWASLSPADHVLPRKLFCRGYHYCLYEAYDETVWLPSGWRAYLDDPTFDLARRNSGLAATILNTRFGNLANARPRSDLSTSGYCYAEPGESYLVYQAEQASFTIGGLVDGATYRVERINPESYSVTESFDFQASGASHTLDAAYANQVVFVERV